MLESEYLHMVFLAQFSFRLGTLYQELQDLFPDMAETEFWTRPCLAQSCVTKTEIKLESSLNPSLFSPSDPKCGQKAQESSFALFSRIVGGHQVKQGSHPWQVCTRKCGFICRTKPWRSKGFRVTSLQPASTCREPTRELERNFFTKHGVQDQREWLQAERK